MDKFKAKLEKANKDKSKEEDINTEDESISNQKLNINDITLIRNAFDYYDKHQEKIKNKFDNVNYISLEITDKDLEHNVMIFYDSEFKELFKSRIEKIGIYDKFSNIWSWAWAVAYFKKNETNIIRKILFYGTELDPTSRFLKTELVTSRFKISNIAQLDMHCAIASYLSKKTQIFKYSISSTPKIIDNKYLDIINQDYSTKNDEKFELVYYHFLLDEI
jgi:hypothetical protein